MNNQRRITRESLAEWNTDDDRDVCDDLHVYFENAFARWDWRDIADEGTSLWGLMFNQELEKYSPADGVIAAVAAQSHHGAIAAVAAALGVEIDALDCAVSPWSENQDDPPPPVGFDGLKVEVEKSQQELEAIHKELKAEHERRQKSETRV